MGILYAADFHGYKIRWKIIWQILFIDKGVSACFQARAKWYLSILIMVLAIFTTTAYSVNLAR